MKTHLPKGLRVALLAALAAVPMSMYNAGAGEENFEVENQTVSVVYENRENQGGGAVFRVSYSTGEGDGVAALSLGSNTSVSFLSNRTLRGDGGAIWVDGLLSAAGNGELIFSGNRASGDGGAIYLQGTALLSGNTVVTFTGNSALSGEKPKEFSGSGGAIHVKEAGSLTIEGNGNSSLTFESNTAGWKGGALNTVGATIFIRNNQQVIFRNNATLSTSNISYNDGGGAIAMMTSSQSSFEMSGNSTVLFEGNQTTMSGGACLFSFGGTSDFRGNYSLTFSGNSALGKGGAIALGRGNRAIFEGNTSLSFTGNTAGGRGGAIYGGVSLVNNGRVEFLDNSAVDGGGALEFGSSSLTIAGNKGDVLFRGNYVRFMDTETGELGNPVLNSISSVSFPGTVTLAAEEGTTLTFYDAVNLQGGGSSKVVFNQYEGAATGGTILFSGEDSEANLRAVWEAAGLIPEGEAFEAALETSRHSLVSTQRMTLHGGTLAVEKDAVLELNDYYSVQAPAGSTIRLSDGGTLEVSVQERDGALSMESGSTLAVSGSPSRMSVKTLALRGATLDYGSSADGSCLALNGSLVMEDATVHYRSDKSGTSETWGEGVSVSGALTTTGTTTVNFISADNARPDGTYTLFTCESFSGNLNDWVLQSGSVWGEGVHIDGALEDASLAESTGLDGRAAIVLTVTPTQPVDPSLGVLHVPTGVNESISDLSRKVSMEGGVLDASAVSATEPLSNDVIRGYAGTVLTSAQQTMVVRGTDTVGYGIDSATAGTSGASLETGVVGGDAASARVQLEGQVYNLTALSVLSGQTTVAQDVLVGQEGDAATMTVSVGSEGGSASLTNNGRINASSVEVKTGSSVTNKGILSSSGKMNLEAGSALRNEGHIVNGESMEVAGVLNNNGFVEGIVNVAEGGVVKGQSSIEEMHLATGAFAGAIDAATQQIIERMTVEQGATLGFYVQPAGQANSSSSMQVGSLTLLGNPDIAVRLGGQMVATEGQSFHLTLLEVDSVAGDGSIDSYTLSGMTQLVDADSVELIWDAETGTLSLSGNLASAAVADVATGDASRLADTLWSSTGSVASFARIAASQARWQSAQGVQFWVAGLGDFLNMGSEGELSGFDYSGGGYAVGGSVRVTKDIVAGAAVGQMFGRHQTDDHLLNDKQRATMFSLYGTAEVPAGKSPVLLSADFAYGSVSHTADTHVGGDAATPGRAKWDDDVFTFGLQAEKKMELSDRLALTPFVGLRYLYGAQDDITETFEGGSRHFRGGSLQTWSIPVGVTLSGVCALGAEQKLLPYLTVAYVGDVARRDPKTGVTAGGESLSGRGHTPGRNGLMTRTGVTWQWNDSWAVGADYHLEVRSGQVNQDVNLHVNYCF